MQTTELKYQLIETPIGQFQAVWSTEGLRSFEFFRSTSSVQWSKAAELPAASRSLSSAVKNYFKTGHFEWDLDLLDWEGVSEFHQKTLRACYGIEPATTLTYGQLATQVGSDGAARAVGGAMARNRWPLLIPCHRVVGSSGKLTGYSGVGGVDTKQKLLDFELEKKPACLATS
jgi:methylated-DNA-[protein]-cysteine S-methyltransferase